MQGDDSLRRGCLSLQGNHSSLFLQGSHGSLFVVQHGVLAVLSLILSFYFFFKKKHKKQSTKEKVLLQAQYKLSFKKNL